MYIYKYIIIDIWYHDIWYDSFRLLCCTRQEIPHAKVFAPLSCLPGRVQSNNAPNADRCSIWMQPLEPKVWVSFPPPFAVQWNCWVNQEVQMFINVHEHHKCSWARLADKPQNARKDRKDDTVEWFEWRIIRRIMEDLSDASNHCTEVRHGSPWLSRWSAAKHVQSCCQTAPSRLREVRRAASGIFSESSEWVKRWTFYWV